MGSCEIQIYGIGKTAKDVFMELSQQNNQEYGFNNGTISTCDSFKMVKLPPRLNIQKFINNRFKDIDKRTCECFELSKSRTTKYKRYNGMKGKRGKVFFFYGWAAC